VRAALEALDPTLVVVNVRDGSPVNLHVDGDIIKLSPTDILVQTQPAPGLAVATDKLITVAIDTTLTPELRTEGLAREVVRRIQAMRKEAGFNIEDRIATYYQAEGDLVTVMQDWINYINAETLTTHLVADTPPAGAYVETYKIDGMALMVGVEKIVR
jgi:isoleucyl-tRNA synthetase